MKCVHIISLVYIYLPVTGEAAYLSDVASETQPAALNFISGHGTLFHGGSYLYHCTEYQQLCSVSMAYVKDSEHVGQIIPECPWSPHVILMNRTTALIMWCKLDKF